MFVIRNCFSQKTADLFMHFQLSMNISMFVNALEKNGDLGFCFWEMNDQKLS